AERTASPEPSVDPLHHPLPQPPRASEFTAGMPVRVPRYGVGVVDSADAQSVNVTFPNGFTRCFLASYVKPRASAGKRPQAPALLH
ncbi:MAG: hypothetical protein ABIV63_18450, partial [Caldimonas sp.]